MTYHLSTPESHHEVHGTPIATPAPEETLRRLRAIERAAQAVVDAAYEERVKEYDEGYNTTPLTVRRCRLCNRENSTHSVTHECPIADLERLLRGVV